ncbi:MAG: GTP-binding protein [Planctomycetales bacterium]|nr:GTP-binding protein [Planctomycetales bacterium]
MSEENPYAPSEPTEPTDPDQPAEHRDGDTAFAQAKRALEKTLARLRSSTEQEREQLRHDLAALESMADKLERGDLEIVVFGEISTGKSALINALSGEQLADVDVQGGWTTEINRVGWNRCSYRLPGFADSSIVLVDTPGLNEVDGEDRAELAREAAARADLILFVTDSDLNEVEYTALTTLAASNKPLILVLNKVDQYNPEQRRRLQEVLENERLRSLLPDAPLVMTSADPREVQYIIESADGTTREEWRRPPPQIDSLKAAILEVLERDGQSLLALNAAMFAADKSDRIASLRVRMRDRQANHTIMSYATLKSIAVALNPLPVVDVLGGSAVDGAMVVTLARIYGLEMTTTHARELVKSILKAAGLVLLGEAVVSVSSSLFKALTASVSTVVSAIPQGAAAGYGSYIVGQAAKYYFEHGASWGGDGPKQVVRDILEQTDKKSVIEQLKNEIRRKISSNSHADRETDKTNKADKKAQTARTDTTSAPGEPSDRSDS